MKKKINHRILLSIGIVFLVVVIIIGRTSNDESVIQDEISPIVEIDSENALYDDLAAELSIVGRILNLPRQLWRMITSPTETQMQLLMRDGFAFTGNPDEVEESVAEIPRIGQRRDDSEEIYMLTWQPAQGFVRQANLIHEHDEDGVTPRATYINSDEPLVYIFNSHPHEMIGSSFADVYIGEMNIIEFSHMLANIFEEHGIPSLVEDRDVRDIMNPNGWGFAQSYQASRIFIEERISQYPSLQFFFDLHRDGIPRDLATITIDGNSYGRILFVIGGNNPAGYAENYQMARRLHEMLEEVKPGLSRGIHVHTGVRQNSIYNQDVASTMQLIEIGTVETTVEEAMNTMEILADVLAEYILNYIDN